jgi:diguanylate cyclase (GGDEF)-like protein
VCQHCIGPARRAPAPPPPNPGFSGKPAARDAPPYLPIGVSVLPTATSHPDRRVSQSAGTSREPAPAHHADALIAALGHLVHRGSGDFTIPSILQDLCRVAPGALGVDGAGVMLLDDDQLRFVHAEPRRVVAVERLQETLQRGPCCDSIAEQRPIAVNDVGTAAHWPELVRGAARAGLGSILAMPLLARERSWGVLDVYRSTAQPWTEQDLAATRLFADVAASYIAMAADHDLTRIARHELEYRATHDDLTGLPNRALLFDRLEQALDDSANDSRAVAVLFVDVDRFKMINDTFGHATGDITLVEVARRLRSTLRDSDTVARLSGDEFVVICENISGSVDQVHRWLQALGRRIQAELRWTIGDPKLALLVSVSVGAAATTEPLSAQELLTEADRAMYRAKESGHGQFVISERGFAS